MKRFWIIITISAITALASCSKDDPKESTNISTGVRFIVEDSEGNDLLNPHNPGHINTSAIRTYYLDGQGNTQAVYLPNTEGPYGCAVGGPPLTNSINYGTILENSYVLGVTLYGTLHGSARDGDTSTSYIKWPEEVTDILECTYRAGQNYLILSEVLVNGEVFWKESNENHNERPFFKIVIDPDGHRTISVIYPYAGL